MMPDYFLLRLKGIALFYSLLLIPNPVQGQWIDSSDSYHSYTPYSSARLRVFNNLHLTQDRVYTDIRYVYHHGVPRRYPLMLSLDKKSGALMDTFFNPHHFLRRGDAQRGFSFFGDYGFYHWTQYRSDSIRGDFYKFGSFLRQWTTTDTLLLHAPYPRIPGDSMVWFFDGNKKLKQIDIRSGVVSKQHSLDSLATVWGYEADSMSIVFYPDVNDSLLLLRAFDGRDFPNQQQSPNQFLILRKRNLSIYASTSLDTLNEQWKVGYNGSIQNIHGLFYRNEILLIDSVNSVFHTKVRIYDLNFNLVDSLVYVGELTNTMHTRFTFLDVDLYCNNNFKLLNFQYPKRGFDFGTQSYVDDFGNNLVLYDSSGTKIYDIHFFNHHRLYSDRLERLVLDDDGSVYAIKYLQRDNHIRSNTLLRIAPDGSNAVLNSPEHELEKGLAQLELYPNPATNQVFLSGMLSSGNYRLRIFVARGQPVLERNFRAADLASFSVAGLCSGLYFWRLENQTGGSVASGKLVKE